MRVGWSVTLQPASLVADIIIIMKIEEYTKTALSTISIPDNFGAMPTEVLYAILGLVGESGEVAEKFKKLIRDHGGQITDKDRGEIVKELGDVLWYVTIAAHMLGSSLEEVAQVNNSKLTSRKSRNKISGSGDNR